jgi:hypothetical protein
LASVVEKWNPHAKIRQDLFGIIDIVAVGERETVGVQACAYSSVSARVRKIAEADTTPKVRAAGWKLLVHGWRKVKGRYQVREVVVS